MGVVFIDNLRELYLFPKITDAFCYIVVIEVIVLDYLLMMEQ